MLRSELEALGAPADKLTLDGLADVPLPSASVQTFCLRCTQTPTNALKYGALAAPHGHLAVRWSLSSLDGGRTRLLVRWRETGVDMAQVHLSPLRWLRSRTHRARTALPAGRETSYELGAEGVDCTIDVPTSAIAE
ncbi:hypothetical protein AB5I41_07660 [Sphingomonas sp. MMS24-JH45]